MRNGRDEMIEKCRKSIMKDEKEWKFYEPKNGSVFLIFDPLF